MSGIAGIIDFSGAPVERALIEQMTGALAHRGPDGMSHWLGGSAALGHCMLCTTPESLQETQPLSNESESLILVMDGRVDNWQELRTDLLHKGCNLRSRSDAELVLRAYETWGDGCLNHIDGDFAIAILDNQKRRLFTARDRIGMKPLNYHFDGNRVAFASELHALLALPWVPEVPNEGMIAEIMSDEWMSRDETIWTGIHRVVASHKVVFSANGPRSECYWRPGSKTISPYKRDADYIEHYRTLLFDTIRKQSRSHRPIACEVSGGLDSSAVFSAAEHLRRQSLLSAPGLQGYSLAFHTDSQANEIAYASAVGEHLGLGIREVVPALHDDEWYMGVAQRCRNVPGFPNGAMSTSLYKIASESNHRVLLGGVGGDHVLTGSLAYYHEELAEGNLTAFSRCFGNDLREIGARRALWRLLRNGLVPFAPMAMRDFVRPAFQALTEKRRGAYWLSPRLREILEVRRQAVKSQTAPAPRRRGQLGLLQSLDYAFDDFAQEAGERLGAHHGLEFRQPFLATEVIEFAFATPDRLRSAGNRNKIIHRESLKGMLPEKVRLRNSKADFSGVFAAKLDHLSEHFTECLPQKRAEWLDADGMKRLWHAYTDQPEAGWQNWALWGTLAIDFASASPLDERIRFDHKSGASIESG